MNFNFQIRSYKKKNGTQAIRLRFFTSANDTQYIDTKVSVLANQWDKKKEIIKRHPLEENLNATIYDLKIKVEKIYYKNKGVSAKRLLQIYKNTIKYDSSSYLSFFQSVIDETRLKGKTRSAKTLQLYHNKLKLFSNYIPFSDIDHNFMKDYEHWLLKRGNKKNTIASNLRCIITTCNQAVKAGVIKKNNARGYKIEKENVVKQSLTLDEIQKVIELEIVPRHKGMIKARDMFLFCFYTAGMRFTDMCILKWENIVGDNIVYTMNKVRDRVGSRRTIPLNSKSKEILEKYQGKNSTFIFPPLYGFENKTQEEIEYKIYIKSNNLNRSLKIIAQKCSINKPLSMHMGKHSFTDYAVKSNVNLLMISKLLGHTRLETTQAYLKDFYQKEESDTINKLFG
ncbi:site-specific integrase [uncultured Tenacibaculum sp.]|uniref:site-specific integrase n=1 Tax=uncultured Tenacibaculum sp. TaxID=174713 RepID=UPI00261997E6|nr:site-specific integrase [uncultured Tenacibaculum sp.]